MDEKRFNDVYQYLVEETENTLTLHDRKKNELLKMLLELFEYLRDQEEENPVIAWFEN